tara:strand:+ start:184 stop:624 length:441 start_codon:yes stop_codon:yes gene_type:complete
MYTTNGKIVYKIVMVMIPFLKTFVNRAGSAMDCFMGNTMPAPSNANTAIPKNIKGLDPTATAGSCGGRALSLAFRKAKMKMTIKPNTMATSAKMAPNDSFFNDLSQTKGHTKTAAMVAQDELPMQVPNAASTLEPMKIKYAVAKPI